VRSKSNGTLWPGWDTSATGLPDGDTSVRMREKGCAPVLIDSHCHLYMPDFDADRDGALARARTSGLTAFVAIGYDLASSRQAVALADREPDVYACVAIHPHHAADATGDALAQLQTLAAHPRVVAIGEIGLDFYRTRAPREIQEAAFRAQLGLAQSLRLPVSIHDRDAHADSMRILSEGADGLPAVILHCFSGDRAMAAEAWKRGYYTAVAGPVTYPNARDLRDLLQDAPRDRILLETDAPYLPPTPHRGKRNEPAYLPLVASRLAAVWGAAPEAVAELTARNTCRALALPLAGVEV
jgi:TatD DNase family protein